MIDFFLHLLVSTIRMFFPLEESNWLSLALSLLYTVGDLFGSIFKLWEYNREYVSLKFCHLNYNEICDPIMGPRMFEISAPCVHFFSSRNCISLTTNLHIVLKCLVWNVIRRRVLYMSEDDNICAFFVFKFSRHFVETVEVNHLHSLNRLNK